MKYFEINQDQFTKLAQIIAEAPTKFGMPAMQILIAIEQGGLKEKEDGIKQD